MSFFSFFFPERCRGCTKRGTALCARCILRIPLATDLPEGTFAVFDYGHHLVRWSVRDLKYHRKSESMRALARAAIPHIKNYLGSTDPIFLVPIPSHNTKKRARGFNQSELIARWWQTEIPTSTIAHVLHKVVFTSPQAHLRRHERLTNLAGTMRADRLDPDHIYVVVDDVSTTGATFLEARRALGEAGAKQIFCIALAHGYAKK